MNGVIICFRVKFTTGHFANPTHPLMGQATLNVGTFHGGLNINSVPDQAKRFVGYSIS